jgi:hypothetical protein
MDFLSPLLLFPYALAVLMPSWRWLAGCVLVVGGFFAIIWIQHWIVSSLPGYNVGPAGAIGLGIFAIATVGFVGGIAVRLVTLSMPGRGRAKARFIMNVLGFALPAAYFAVPAAWDAWRLRPPSEACTNATFDIDIARNRFVIPAAPMFNIYLGRSAARDAYYLDLLPSLRDFCARTDTGRRRTRATHLWIRFDNAWPMADTTCAGGNADWANELCTAIAAVRIGDIDDTDFPIGAHLYVLDDVLPGQFGGSASTYDDSGTAVAGPARDSFVRTHRLAADGKPLTYACREMSGGVHWCKTSYPWQNGAHLTYVFRSDLRNVEEKGARADATVRQFLALLQRRSAH